MTLLRLMTATWQLRTSLADNEAHFRMYLCCGSRNDWQVGQPTERGGTILTVGAPSSRLAARAARLWRRKLVCTWKSPTQLERSLSLQLYPLSLLFCGFQPSTEQLLGPLLQLSDSPWCCCCESNHSPAIYLCNFFPVDPVLVENPKQYTY